MDQTHLSEDAVSQSGWIFADLLVALSVIFLATISFIPNQQSGSGAIQIEPGKILRSDGFSVLYNSVSVSDLVKDLESYRLDQSWATGVEVVHLQFIGSSKDSGERSGILDALEFSIALQNSSIDGFQDISTSLDTSALIEPGQVLVRAVFGVSKSSD